MTCFRFCISDHNRTHASDVLHAVFYLTSQPIPGFQVLPFDSDPPSDTLLGTFPSIWFHFIRFHLIPLFPIPFYLVWSIEYTLGFQCITLLKILRKKQTYLFCTSSWLLLTDNQVGSLRSSKQRRRLNNSDAQSRHSFRGFSADTLKCHIKRRRIAPTLLKLLVDICIVKTSCLWQCTRKRRASRHAASSIKVQ